MKNSNNDFKNSNNNHVGDNITINKYLLQESIKRPDDLSKIILALKNVDIELKDDIDDIVRVEVEKKIKYNNLNNSKWIIEDYPSFYQLLENIYKELENDGKINRIKIYSSIKNEYQTKLNELLVGNKNKMEIIQNNSDDLINAVKDRLIIRITDADSNLEKTNIDTGVLMIVTDAFIKCKILEEVPEDYIF